jgi:hypothetical protein
MATPVKTRVMDAIVERIEAISSVDSVIRRGPLPNDEQTKERPTVFVFDDDEYDVESRNCIRRAKFPLNIWIRVHDEQGREAISNQLDIMQADTHYNLIADKGATLQALGVRVQDSGPTQKIFDDQFQGAIKILYTITYNTNKDSLYTEEYDVNTVLT